MYFAATVTAVLLVACSMTFLRSKVALAGKHVIITGGSEGLGFALAKELCTRRCRVTIVARTQSKLDQAVTELQELALPEVQVQALKADVTEYEQASSLRVCVKDKHFKFYAACGCLGFADAERCSTSRNNIWAK